MSVLNSRFIKQLGLTALSAALAACSPGSPPASQAKADLILNNAKVYTVDEQQPWAEAVAVKDGKIVFVGSNQEVQQWAGDNTQLQDLAGKMLLPGFIDSHAHPAAGGAYVRSLSLDTYATPKDWVKAVADYAAANPDAPVLFGYGFLASAFGPEGPTAAQLDSVVADRPVFIMDEGFHGGWANSKAMQVLGINKNTPDITPGFSYYKRDAQGNPTGYFLEDAASAAVDALNIINPDSVALGTADVFDIMNSYGITAVFDAGALSIDDIQIEVLDKLYEQGEFTVRMVGSHAAMTPESYNTAIEKTVAKRNASKRPMYHINTLKIMDDGTIEGRTAGMFEDYQGEPGNKGTHVFSQAQMDHMVTEATAKDIDVHIHALGERAIADALNAIEAAKKAHPNSSSRHAICHVQVIRDQEIKRFAELGVTVQSTPLWASYDDFGEQFVSADQFNRYFRFNTLKEAGVKMAFGSDYPATGAGTLGMSPLFNIEIGHTRQSAGEPNAKIQPNINERLDIATLIRGYTINGAYQMHMEDQIGSISVGKLADFVVLADNIFEVDPYQIHKVAVSQTYLGGKLVYSQP
ncbi:amidohydrolase family protein [Dasania sp. GY-MA-18]|uniref:Amidohydrolase family protein n=1 Tax=Dasania phycosphaerae TaxID=2950436 RepID=A0A9J6RGM6_9GAMM|nr:MULTISPECIES: amidohydrolase family protein [Dasania]MCR8921200.1 amidohydrolase family protein [Dasania sp. GY-MA-18]MCZ0863628.1 amidohydrolase family protein [Dasania phycosphaerae]MCZ0867356.1 amidohydrolase family protein [Dasania phycosphaerae]